MVDWSTFLTQGEILDNSKIYYDYQEEDLLSYTLKTGNTKDALEVIDGISLILAQSSNHQKLKNRTLNNSLQTYLHLAAKYHNLEVFERLVKITDRYQPDAIFQDFTISGQGNDVMSEAISAGNFEVVKYLLDSNLRIIFPIFLDNTQLITNNHLHLALKIKNGPILKLLLEHMIWVSNETKNSSFISLLDSSSEQEMTNIILEALLFNDYLGEKRDNRGITVSIFEFIKKEIGNKIINENKIKKLISYRNEVCWIRDSLGVSLLGYAAYRGNNNVYEKIYNICEQNLVENNRSIEDLIYAVDKDGNNILHYLFQNNKINDNEVYKHIYNFLEKYEKFDQQLSKINNDGMTPIYHLINERSFLNFKNLFIEKVKKIKHLKVNALDSLITFLVRKGDLQSVNDLLDLNPSFVNHKDANGNGLLMVAINNNNYIMFTGLLKRHNIKIDNEDDVLKDPAAYAVANNKNEFLLSLLRHGLKVERSFSTGENLIHIAVKYKNHEALGYLLGEAYARGLDSLIDAPYRGTNDSHTQLLNGNALTIAVQGKSQLCIETLLKFGANTNLKMSNGNTIYENISKIINVEKTLDAIDYTDSSNIQIKDNRFIEVINSDGGWIGFRNIDFGTGVNEIKINYANKEESEMAILLDNTSIPPFAHIPLTSGKGKDSWKIHIEKISPIKGVHNVFLKIKPGLSLKKIIFIGHNQMFDLGNKIGKVDNNISILFKNIKKEDSLILNGNNFLVTENDLNEWSRHILSKDYDKLGVLLKKYPSIYRMKIPNLQNLDSITYAIENSMASLLRYLLVNKPSILDEKFGSLDRTILHLVVENKNIKLLEMVMQEASNLQKNLNALLKAKDIQGISVYLLAFKKSFLEGVRELERFKIDIGQDIYNDLKLNQLVAKDNIITRFASILETYRAFFEDRLNLNRLIKTIAKFDRDEFLNHMIQNEFLSHNDSFLLENIYKYLPSKIILRICPKIEDRQNKYMILKSIVLKNKTELFDNYSSFCLTKVEFLDYLNRKDNTANESLLDLILLDSDHSLLSLVLKNAPSIISLASNNKHRNFINKKFFNQNNGNPFKNIVLNAITSNHSDLFTSILNNENEINKLDIEDLIEIIKMALKSDNYDNLKNFIDGHLILDTKTDKLSQAVLASLDQIKSFRVFSMLEQYFGVSTIKDEKERNIFHFILSKESNLNNELYHIVEYLVYKNAEITTLLFSKSIDGDMPFITLFSLIKGEQAEQYMTLLKDKMVLSKKILSEIRESTKIENNIKEWVLKYAQIKDDLSFALENGHSLDSCIEMMSDNSFNDKNVVLKVIESDRLDLFLFLIDKRRDLVHSYLKNNISTILNLVQSNKVDYLEAILEDDGLKEIVDFSDKRILQLIIKNKDYDLLEIFKSHVDITSWKESLLKTYDKNFVRLARKI